MIQTLLLELLLYPGQDLLQFVQLLLLALPLHIQVDQSFDAGLVTDLGLGFEFGDLAVDGLLEKNFLRDGPHFIGGSSRGGGLLTTLSLLYRLYP